MTFSVARIIGMQIEANPGRRVDRIRLHPEDRRRLVEELRESGFSKAMELDDAGRLGGIPLLDDETLVEGPVVEFGITLAEWDRQIAEGIRLLGGRGW